MTETYYDFAAHDFLKLKSAELDQDTISKLNSGGIRLEDADFFVAAQVTGLAGTVDLVTPSTSLKKGTVNFDKASLPKFQNLVLKAVAFSYGTDAAEVDPAKVDYTSKTATIDNAIKRANLVIKQGDKIVFEHPVRNLISEEAQRGPGAANAYELKNWRLIVGDRQLQIQLEFPEGQSVDAVAKHHVEVRLLGTKTRIK